MAVKVMRKDNQFRVQGQEVSLDWIADTVLIARLPWCFYGCFVPTGANPFSPISS
jgi:hypothetical protein